MRTSATIIKLAPALLAAQRAMGDAVKGSKNPFFKSSYADLNSIREAVTPALNANGVVLLQPISTYEGHAYVETTLLHESGEYMTSETAIVVAKQNDPQAQGSAISYARRYGLQAMLSVGAVDDDGESAMQRGKPAVVEVTAASVLALAQTTVARKKSEKQYLAEYVGHTYKGVGDTLTDQINSLGQAELEEFNIYLKGLLNGNGK